ncbi:tyrosine-type recombinase/integrase [Limimaricola sp. AA108-03]|uniref:tyrosine-type recombinase/integrase n=1 Tax=Limimaricola sp. AA108-03 TaxID=3425945 RepID=UPI003D771129
MQRKLTAVAIKRAGPGKMQDGGGLRLDKSIDTGKWVYRYSHLGRRREMGLGSWPTVSLADARKERDRWAAVLAGGQDPIEERDAQREAELAERSRTDPTFAEMVAIVFEARRAGLRGDGKRGRWLSPLEGYIIPAIGRIRMSEIRQTDVHRALAPIWRTKHPTAIKAVHRTKRVFTEARLMGYECDPFAVDQAKYRLGEVIHKETPIVSTPWQDIPALWERLHKGAVSDACLRFMLLTLVRLDGCAGARVDEIEDGIWTVPAERMKGREGRVEEFRVPLSDAAMAIVREAEPFADNGLLFPGARGTPISSTALEKRLTHVGEAGRPHGFRSSFRSWVQDTDACSWEVSEKILAHTIGNKVERAYARSDLLERRRPVMQAWADYVTGVTVENVVPLRGCH